MSLASRQSRMFHWPPRRRKWFRTPFDEKAARVLRVVDGKLTAQRTGGQRQALTPIGKDEFLYQDGLNRFTIQRDGKGAVSGMRLFAEGEGDGAVVARTAEALPPARQEMPLLAADLARVQGTYSANGTDMKVFMDGKQLKTQLANQPAVELFAEAPNKFFLTVVDATLEFAGVKGNAPSVTLHQGGQVIEFKRTP